ncbi:sugar phosphate isomerase/epimerase [Corynebacterium uropygiale]|uniref:Sugar phosphate isomerase/epimerase n=1 Tax=Corynebacterium uropygiale TaxID=1775911 RepID=A0A9X1QUZ3_9CORY|nr:TIM barrel protein [Corynebacterium uropygiale]MCF4007485.1 sugar phosphate isomerase/epimerase [Corynebacterium uropygiale]
MREFGLAPLSALQCAPDAFVRAAAQAGFDFVGLRVQAVTETEPQHDLRPGSPLHQATLRALEETGLHVKDTEFLCVTEHTTPADWEQALDTAASFGARTFTVSAGDPEEERLIDTLGAMARSAATRGIEVTVEPISYQAVRTIPQAVRVARAAGVKVLADILHLGRVGATPEEVASARDLIPMVQLCDAPAQAPATREGLVEEARGLRLAPGDGDLEIRGILDALPDIPLSVEAPHPRGAKDPRAWITYLAQQTKGWR